MASFHVESKRCAVCTKLHNLKMEEEDTSETLMSAELYVFISKERIS
jgi:hypothetical protein